ncbi:class I SAM-dependent methyltransferase, partial [Streptomyces sp. NPDC058855]
MTSRAATRPVGTVTRGTTNPNRLRRMDRWIAATHGVEMRRAVDPVAVDLGYGAAPWTAVELLARLRAAAPHARVVGVEIEPARVTAAKPYERDGLVFRHGGFEIPVEGRPHLIRAANVLRQYDEPEVASVWERLCARLAPAGAGSRGGLLVEGTCDEIGRRHVWVALGP